MPYDAVAPHRVPRRPTPQAVAVAPGRVPRRLTPHPQAADAVSPSPPPGPRMPPPLTSCQDAVAPRYFPVDATDRCRCLLLVITSLPISLSR
ncbi:hypothetical protein GUJ93_ZPchr0009g881 [Zizania palustris]|uniref:Uncharacterized protein n=1 Tax=Zizania palustris TaxID=103762 RepID=A0A8J5R4L4_ZIZPA|nr:hypothetical protein GUJ93_ZPchr0009g881 [Zizania palustris]